MERQSVPSADLLKKTMCKKLSEWLDKLIYGGDSKFRVEIMPEWLSRWCCPKCGSDAFVEHNYIFYCAKCEYEILKDKRLDDGTRY